MKNTIILLGLMIIFGLFGCHRKKEEENIHKTFVLSPKMLKTTRIAKANMQTVKNELHFYGKITADNNKLIEIYPVVGGSVSQVFVELGDYVEKGQLLATIRSTEVASSEKELDDAKNDIIVSENNLKVAQELFDGKLNTERDIIEARSQFEKAKSQLRRIQETYRIYNIKPGAIFEVRAPINGFVIEKKINQDMLLRSDNTDNIFDIAEISDVWAIANVNESDINQVKLGVDAEVSTLSYPDRIFKGHVDKLFNIIDPETKAMKVKIQLDNKDFLLKPEMRANIKIAYNESKKMIAIPSSAVIFDKSKYFVMVFKDRHDIETREVEVYREVGDLAYISKGIKEAEQVMTQNQLLVYDALND